MDLKRVILLNWEEATAEITSLRDDVRSFVNITACIKTDGRKWSPKGYRKQYGTIDESKVLYHIRQYSILKSILNEELDVHDSDLINYKEFNDIESFEEVEKIIKELGIPIDSFVPPWQSDAPL